MNKFMCFMLNQWLKLEVVKSTLSALHYMNEVLHSPYVRPPKGKLWE
jgi:hypothetical protein